MTALAPANKRAEGKPRTSSDAKIMACPLPHPMMVAKAGLWSWALKRSQTTRPSLPSYSSDGSLYADSFKSVGFLGSCMVWNPGIESTDI